MMFLSPGTQALELQQSQVRVALAALPAGPPPAAAAGTDSPLRRWQHPRV